MIRMLKSPLLAAAGVTLAASPALAHTSILLGGDLGAAVAHLAEPDHLLAIALLLSWAVLRRLPSPVTTRIAQASGMLGLVLAAGILAGF